MQLRGRERITDNTCEGGSRHKEEVHCAVDIDDAATSYPLKHAAHTKLAIYVYV